MTATEQPPPDVDTGDGEARPVAGQLEDLLNDEFGDRISTIVQWDQLTVDADAASYLDVVRFCRDDPRLDCDFFDHLAGVDEREDGFAIVANLYSTRHRHRVMVRHLCEGGRDNPVAPSLTDLYYGANWHEREAWDMFGIEFDGHPGLAPRILTTENFEGWPLRKDFYLGTREAKPWPGIKEPLELDDEGNPIERVRGGVPGEAPGPMALDEAMAEQARRANDLLDDEPVELAEGEADEAEPEAPHTTAPGGEAVQASPAEEASARAERARRKAAELRRQKREERGEEQPDQGLEDTPAQERRADEARASEATGHTSTAADGQGGPPGVPPEPESPQEQGTTPADDVTEPGHTRGGGPGSQPAQAGDEPAPGAEAGEPPDTQAPGEAPVEGGLRETVDEEADRIADATGGERPGSVDAAQDTSPATELDGGDRPESVDRARDEHPPDRDSRATGEGDERAAEDEDPADDEDATDDEDGDAPAPPHRDPIGDAVAEARRNAEREGREHDDGGDTHE